MDHPALINIIVTIIFVAPSPLKITFPGPGVVGGEREGKMFQRGWGWGEIYFLAHLFSSPSIYIIIYYKDHEFPALSQSLGVLGNLLAEGFRDYIII